MGKSKRMKKWGGAPDPNAVYTEQGQMQQGQGQMQQGQGQQQQGPGQMQLVQMKPGQGPEKKNYLEQGLESVTSFFGFGSEPATSQPVTGQAGGGRRRKRSHKKRSRRSKRSRRHR